jgi:hypothetical protein
LVVGLGVVMGGGREVEEGVRRVVVKEEGSAQQHSR